MTVLPQVVTVSGRSQIIVNAAFESTRCPVTAANVVEVSVVVKHRGVVVFSGGPQ